VAGTCKNSNEPLGLIKCGEFLDRENRLFSQEGLWSVE
jgi:hypothetical protein